VHRNLHYSYSSCPLLDDPFQVIPTVVDDPPIRAAVVLVFREFLLQQFMLCFTQFCASYDSPIPHKRMLLLLLVLPRFVAIIKHFIFILISEPFLLFLLPTFPLSRCHIEK